ncbi:MAG: transcriptional regulator [Ignavibacteria bacterium]|nr:transcriptional regulator [Ignavibacteria bacterium]
MKSIIKNLNKVFESRIRLGVMSILLVNDRVDFNTLKKLLNVTDGNLASHINALQNKKYIKVKKQFLNKKPNTSYAVSELGKKAFNDHLNALEKIIKKGVDF